MRDAWGIEDAAGRAMGTEAPAEAQVRHGVEAWGRANYALFGALANLVWSCAAVGSLIVIGWVCLDVVWAETGRLLAGEMALSEVPVTLIAAFGLSCALQRLARRVMR